MTPRTLTADRDMLAELALEFWSRYRADDADEVVNAITDKSDVIVRYWAAGGRLGELLTPMLDDNSVEVRYLASAYLVRHDPSDRAWQALFAISRGPYGPISLSADLLLMEQPK